MADAGTSHTITVIMTLAMLLPRTGLGEPTAADSSRPVASRPVNSRPAAELRAVPPILDPDYRHRKTNQLELVAFGSTYLGASVKKSWIVGTRLLFHLNNMFAVGGSYGYQWTSVNSLSSAGAPLTDRHTQFLDAEVAISNDVAMRLGAKLVEMDLYMTLGAGAVRLDGQWDFLGVIGGGVKFYTGLPWLAVRIDVNTLLHSVDHPAGAEVDADISFALGLCLLFPSDPSPLERR